MPLPVPNLDDRRFDDLVAEAQARLQRHLPDLTQIAPGDPANVFIDLFAWLTETILFRANLIPERQRRVFLNLLQLPLRSAQAASGIVCIDAGKRTVQLDTLVPAASELKAGNLTLTTSGEVRPTPLLMAVMIKERLSSEALREAGIDLGTLKAQYGQLQGEPTPFRPRTLAPGAPATATTPMTLADSIDKAYYLAFGVPRPLVAHSAEVLAALSGIALNIAVAPADDQVGDQFAAPPSRKLRWELAHRETDGKLYYLPLEIVGDSSRGGRVAGVARLRLPHQASLFQPLIEDDPLYAGYGALPPEPPESIGSDQLLFWLRLSCPEEPDLSLGYLGVNGVEVVALGIRRDTMLDPGTGQPDQVIALPDTNIEPGSLVLDVEEDAAWVTWEAVENFAGRGPDERVYRLDAQAGQVHFGDGLRGRRPAAGIRIRAAQYRHGGGSAGNLPAGTITELVGANRFRPRHEWPIRGGVDAESVAQAERRIPDFLNHRDRAVTREDFQALALSNPINAVARAEVIEGFIPGASLSAVRRDVPGAVSVFVLPPAEAAVAAAPKPTQGLLKDVFTYLRARALLGTELYVLSPQFVRIAVAVRVRVAEPQTEQQTLRAVEQALVRYLWPLPPGGPQGTGWPMPWDVDPAELRAQVARVDGVIAVSGLNLYAQGDQGWHQLADGASLPMQDYQVPELAAVSVQSGRGAPDAPSGLAPQPDGGAPGGIPTPVIPDIC